MWTSSNQLRKGVEGEFFDTPSPHLPPHLTSPLPSYLPSPLTPRLTSPHLPPLVQLLLLLPPRIRVLRRCTGSIIITNSTFLPAHCSHGRTGLPESVSYRGPTSMHSVPYSIRGDKPFIMITLLLLQPVLQPVLLLSSLIIILTTSQVRRVGCGGRVWG